jgi:hypothetical protein
LIYIVRGGGGSSGRRAVGWGKLKEMVEEKRNENGVFDVLNGQRGKNYKTRNASLRQWPVI